MLDIRKVDSRFADGESGAQDRRIFPLRTTLKRIWQGRSGRLFASSVVSASMPSMPSTTSTYSALQLPSTSHQDDDNDRQKPYVNAYEGWGEGAQSLDLRTGPPHLTLSPM